MTHHPKKVPHQVALVNDAKWGFHFILRSIAPLRDAMMKYVAGENELDDIALLDYSSLGLMRIPKT